MSTPGNQISAAGKPLAGEDLRTALETIQPGQRLQESFSRLPIAYMSLGFARTVSPELRGRSQDMINTPLKGALDALARTINTQALIDAAKTYDEAGEGSNSLATALNLGSRLLQSSSGMSNEGDRVAARKLIDELRQSVITVKSEEMKTVQFWRNKAGAHPSSDPLVDPWAQAHPLTYDVIEVALLKCKRHSVNLLT